MNEESQPGSRVLHVFNNIVTDQPEANKPETRKPNEKPSRRWVYWQMTRAVTKKVAHAPFSIHSWGALRRTILSNILPDNILYRYKAYQQGECNRCGLCCKIQFQCPFFIDEGTNNTSCSIYTTPYAPQACLKFPLDPMDLRLLQREIGNACTFSYEGAPQTLSILDFVKLYTQGVKEQFAKRKLKEAPDSGD